ncbi:lipopolysaccharide biosynthesis protein [Microbacter margulisiae]|uniref:O-antigen/teichoic acid export membrane protein n=1 Tax=Microbacter margulisiae TaxID=1350067 RepID=A0A7W5DQJ2_9PORP|nr:hypothetical protein [Microbacter margulisiae]MBB3187207.1 O-antigen/teichoic acid export membrane protein [Microbacter margulisiae]
MEGLRKIKYFISSKIGIDKAIGFTIGGNLIQAAGSIVSLSLIALFLTKEEQGFYYTFGSILAIQVFFQLGFDTIITQYAAHETAHISTFNISQNETEQKAQSRLSSLLHFCIRWFSTLSIGLFVVLMIAGYLFFSKYSHNSNVEWKYPWIILVFNTCLAFIVIPIFSFIQGLGKVKEMAKLRLIQQSVNLIVLWILLYFGGHLYSAPVAGTVSLLIALVLLAFSEFRITLLRIWKLLGRWHINYKQEIFPYQWKIAVSWISGYFIFQLFNPVLFATSGAIVAGQMGMTMAVFNGLSGLTMSWITTKVPTFSKLFAKRDFKFADNLFNKTFKQVLSLNFLGVLALISIIVLLRYFKFSIGSRFLPVHLVVILGIGIFVNQMVFSWATYLRCHKKEPYLITSVVTGILAAASTLILGRKFGVNGLVIGYVTIICLMKIWEYRIFIHSKKIWHG